MKFHIFEVITYIGHMQHSTQFSLIVIKGLLLIQAMQYIALLLPNDGWGQWKYEDNYLTLMHILSSACLGTPFLIGLQNLAFAITIIVIIIFIYFAIILLIAGFNLIKIELYDSSLRTLYYFVIFSNQVLQLPILALFLAQIFCSRKSIVVSCEISTQVIINLIGLIIFSIYLLVGQYFLRSYSFQPFNRLQAKFNLGQPLFSLLLIILFSLHHVESNALTNFAELTIFHFCILLQLRQYIYNSPLLPELNQFAFCSLFTVYSMVILVTINVSSDNTIIPEEVLLAFMMLLATVAFGISTKLYEILKDMLYETISTYQSIGYTQELYDYYNKYKENNKSYYFHYLYNLIEKHIIKCKNKCFQQKYKKNHSSLCKPTIFCVLTNELIKAKTSQQIAFEELELYYINFLSIQCKKPLLGYVELKKFELLSQYQTYYFKKMRYQINRFLQNLIQKQQNKNKLVNSTQNERQLEIKDILSSLHLQQRYLIKIMEILDQKIGLWGEQIKGYNSIYDFEQQAVKVSDKILKLRQDLQQNTQINLSKLEHIPFATNVIEIKIAALFFSAIMNDYYSTSICESTISEVFNIEHTLQDEIITNLKLVEDKVVLIMLSMVKNRGQIVNPEKRSIAQYFNYDEQDFAQISNISQLMPNFVGDIHDQLLSDYLQNAKSNFFLKYLPVFSLTKEGYLQAQQLKIDNNFLSFDDYVLVGCMSQIKQGTDYILFGDDGRIWGMTRGFFQSIIQTYDEQFSIKRAVYSLYIYMFIPTLCLILDEFKQKNNQEIQVQDVAILWAHYSIRDTINLFQQQQIHIPSKHTQFTDKVSSMNSMRQKISEQTISNDTNKQIYSQLGDPSFINQSQENKVVPQIPLYNNSYQEQISKFITILQQTQLQKYIIKYTLQFKTIGQQAYQKQFFVLEITELRKRDLISQGDSGIFHISNQSVMNNKNDSDVQLSQITMSKELIQEVTPHKYDSIDYQKLLEIHAQQGTQRYQELQQLLGLESGKDSISYGPLSQRIQFISPAQQQIQLDDFLDKELIELQEQLDDRGNFSKVADLQADVDAQEESQVNNKEKSSVDQKKDESDKLLKLIKFNKTKGNYQKEDEEFGAQYSRSRSSATSGTSGISAIQVIKKFQQKTQMISSLTMIMAINLFVGLTLIIYAIVHLTIVSSNNQQTIETIDDINGPMLFNRYFCKLFSYSWALIYNSLKIVDSSDFIINTFIRQMKEMLTTVFNDFAQMYPTFINVEQKNLMEKINLDLLYQPSEEVTYTYFSNFIENTAKELFTAVNFNLSTIDNLITRTYMDNLLLLRYNLKNVVTTTTELIDSINTLFFSQLDSRTTSMQIQISIEIIVCFIIFFLQIYFWNKLETYAQQILLLAGRLQETQAQEMITRMSFIKETITQNIGQYSWKKQNFYTLGYLSINQLGIEKIGTQSKVLREYQYRTSHVQKQNINQNNKKKNLNVVLNSRIYKTQTTILLKIILITITFAIFLIFILGGYLLVDSQAVELQPSQQLIMNYIKFSTQFDILITCGIIIKTQNLVYQKLISQGIYTQQEISSFRDDKAIIKIFIPLINTYNQNLSQIYSNILSSKKISDNHKSILFKLYEDNYCDTVGDKIRFCNFNSSFVQDYGKYGPQDDNREFLSQGIIGAVSRVDTLINQIFQYEINNVDYDPDDAQLIQQVKTKEFTNAFIQHFIDTNDGTSYFLDIISLSISEIMQDDLKMVYIYYIVTCISIEILFLILYFIWISKTNQRLIHIRMILVNLPIEILTEQHTLSLLKRLD